MSVNILHTLRKRKGIVACVVLLIALFYWYEIRPIIVYRSCNTIASTDARKLLRSKAEIARGTEQQKAYLGLIERNMYLRSDYESFLQKCLLHHGMQMEGKDAVEDDTADETTEEVKE